MAAVTTPELSWVILVSLLMLLASSSAIFYFLTKRWTFDRPRAALHDWSRQRGYKVTHTPHAKLPASLQSLQSLDAKVESILHRHNSTVVRLITTEKPIPKTKRWHLLIRETKGSHVPMGLRPAHAERSFLDLFTLTAFPSILPSDRYVVFASESKHAQEIANAPFRGLMPPDIGLLLHGNTITIDFSSRPFDSVEFERMLAVMNQIAAREV
jgi:hypothetical protein